MEPARERLRPVLEAMPFRDPEVPVYTNVDAEPVRSGGAAREALLRQVASPVRFEDSVRRMAADGFLRFSEVGPGRVLAGLVRRIRKDAEVLPASVADEIEAGVGALGGSP